VCVGSKCNYSNSRKSEVVLFIITWCVCVYMYVADRDRAMTYFMSLSCGNGFDWLTVCAQSKHHLYGTYY
jgi:hypothetical protein